MPTHAYHKQVRSENPEPTRLTKFHLSHASFLQQPSLYATHTGAAVRMATTHWDVGEEQHGRV